MDQKTDLTKLWRTIKGIVAYAYNALRWQCIVRTHLGPLAIEYITTLFNLSVTTCQIPAIWKYSLTIPIPKHSKNTSHGPSYRPISLLCSAVKVMEALLLPTINKYLLPAQDQHGFRREHLATSALPQLTTDITRDSTRGSPQIELCAWL